MPATEAAQEAQRLYEAIDLSYEAARVSLLLGQIYQAQGKAELAQVAAGSALSTFESIGAVPDADRARQFLAALEDPAHTRELR